MVSGTYAFIHIGGAGYYVGKSTTGERLYTVVQSPSADWIVVTRDLTTDSKGGFTIDSLKVETDGEAQFDAVYLGRSLRDLNRMYPVPAEKK